MTDDQLAKVRRLARCWLPPGGWDRRFVHTLLHCWGATRKPLSPRQASMLEVLHCKYREQIARQDPEPEPRSKPPI